GPPGTGFRWRTLRWVRKTWAISYRRGGLLSVASLRLDGPGRSGAVAPQRPADRQHDLARHGVDHDGRGGVPGHEGGHDADEAADRREATARGRAGERADEEQDLGHFQRQEDEEDGDVDPGAPEQHVRVEDREREEDPAQRRVDLGGLDPA